MKSTKRCCYLHVGMHKTGTTSIQNFLQHNKGILAENDIYVPESGRWRDGHHNLAWQCTNDPRFTEDNGSFDSLKNELENTTQSKVVLSSEDFGNAPTHKPKYQFLKNYFEALNFDVKIIAYIRPQYNSFDSLYTEQIKLGLHSKDFDTYIKDTYQNPKMNLEGYFQLWSSHFENVRISNIETLTVELEDHFLAALDVDDSVSTSIDLVYPARINERIGPKTVEAYRIATELQAKFSFTPTERHQTRLELARLCRKKRWNDVKFSALTPKIAQEIMDHYKNSNYRFFESLSGMNQSFTEDANLLSYNKTLLDMTKLSKDEFRELTSTAEQALLSIRYP